ncbi:prepilin-type N-terminal cleavage/methylation domain-containing protein [Actinoplanes sp. NPDC051346]|uniref:prepilin-type N-terminal cleavage/methylation domain-containing protein n=1 Tax=Actinoplanes sp. NPDC051346 TaxID=3155048 RepID=UPI00342E23A9
MQDIISRLRAKKDDEGFTLIELLVVVVIIGVLVAIAVPVYLNYREGAADKSAQSDVRGAISAIEQFYSKNGNKYPDSIFGANDGSSTGKEALPLQLAPDPEDGTITLSENTSLGYVLDPAGSGASTYLICAQNDGGTDNVWYLYDSSKGGSVKEIKSTTMGTDDCS